jgi:hypothetical protein
MARYIDADALLEELQEELDFESLLFTKEQSEWFDKGLKCAVRDVKHQPTADVVEVRHGHWIHKVKRYPYQPDDCEAVCSVCGMDYALDPEYTIKYFAMHNKFCPNCGARMDGDEG